MKRAQIRIDGLQQDAMLRDLLEGKLDLLIELIERLLKGLSNRDYAQSEKQNCVSFDEKYITVACFACFAG
jgi:hypothetical protein